MVEINRISKPDLSDIVITSHAFGLLRKALFENMGNKKAKGLLLRFGRDLGKNKALELMKLNFSIEELIEMVSVVHSQAGHVADVEKKPGAVRLSENNQLDFSDATGRWVDSFEAKLHLQLHGVADECSCYVLSGYASGYMSAILNDDIFVKELTCRAKGDLDCTFAVNSREYWTRQSGEEPAIYDDQTILSELEDTYDKLLFKNKLLDKVTHYHSQLTDAVARQQSLDQVIAIANEILGIPIAIEDLNGNLLHLHGIQRETYTRLRHVKNKKKHTLFNRNRTSCEQIGSSYLLTTPIYLQDRLFATCSFIYIDSREPETDDYLFLERLATASTLSFLNEKISFETTERLKISILDRLIHKQFNTIGEITSQLKYVSPDLRSPFITLAVMCTQKKTEGKPLDHYDQLLQFAKTLKYYKLDGLLSQNNDEIVILLFAVKDSASLLRSLKPVLTIMEENNSDVLYKIGISQPFQQLAKFEESLTQAEQSLHLPRQQKIVAYDQLGLLGSLLQGADIQHLKATAKKELGNLLDEDDKHRELLYTLYIYLIHGGKLEKTMQQLSLSIGGIQYRIRKIEDILQKDLKNFSTASYLLLMIEALIATGDIKIEE
ncbi:V4R domain-containing protein [Cohnella sp. AR92]|uniref:helix-turn-helix domain-containing protein n=1 Tax=Cohnella sp. AR92 TaxID=648716 RepID=UPI000F8D35B5|nr:V4R domain-containing protein [Cohnella sp. AR92]RUS46228.1 hypothetical protein ELR57_14215 [Cohnella sp. AR92]